MNLMNETWKKAVAKTGWAGMAAVLGLVAAIGSARLYAADSDAATRQYNVAVGLQNREAYDLATGAWASFLRPMPTTRGPTTRGTTWASVTSSRPSARPAAGRPMWP